MLKHLRLLALCLGLTAGVGCDRSLPPTAPGPTAPTPTPQPPPAPPPPNPTVTVEFGGRVVDADTGDPVANVRVSLRAISGETVGWVQPKDTATSATDGTFTLALSVPGSWKKVWLDLSGPSGYDATQQEYERRTAGDRPTIRIYPTLVIRPGESIDVRVDTGIVWCGWDGVPCRRVLVAASPGESVELEVEPHESSKPMALGLALKEPDDRLFEPDMSVRRLRVPPGRVPYVVGSGTATLTAR